jgi:hypothetical protein
VLVRISGSGGVVEARHKEDKPRSEDTSKQDKLLHVIIELPWIFLEGRDLHTMQWISPDFRFLLGLHCVVNNPVFEE